MKRRLATPLWLDNLLMGALAALLAYVASTALAREPGLWLLWLASGFLVGIGLGALRPATAIGVAVGTPALVLFELARALPGVDGPTASALAAGFGLFWAGLGFVGALLGGGLRLMVAKQAA